MSIRLVVLCCSFCLLLGCSRPVSESELAGRYQAGNSEGNANLDLHPDGSYVQDIHVASDGKEETTSGKWSFDPKEQYVTLLDAFSVTHDSLSLKVNADVIPVSRRFFFFGSIELNNDPDWDVPYRKKK